MENLTYLDWGCIWFLTLSILFGLLRGFGPTLISVLVWTASFIVAQFFARFLSIPLQAYLEDPELLLLVPFIAVFLISLIVLNMLFSLLAAGSIKLDNKSVSQLLGGLLALPLSFVQALVAVNFARLMDFDENVVWTTSQFIPTLMQFEILWENYVLKLICAFLPEAQCYY